MSRPAGRSRAKGSAVGDQVIALRSDGQSFSAIAKTVGVAKSRDAFGLFADAVATRSRAEQVRLRAEETRRLDALEKRTRRIEDEAERDRKLTSLQGLRDRLAGAVAAG